MALSEEQLNSVKDAYSEMIIDNMDHTHMRRLLLDVVRSDMEIISEEELKTEIVEFYDEKKWEELTEEL